jgi:hypothetical protein
VLVMRLESGCSDDMARWRDGQFRVDEEWCGDAAVFVNWLYRTFCIFNVSMVPDGHHHKALKGKAPGHGPTGTKSAIRDMAVPISCHVIPTKAELVINPRFNPKSPVSNIVLLLQTVDSATCRSPAPFSVHSSHLQESARSEPCLPRLTRPFPPPVSRECRAEERSADGSFVDAPAAIGPYCQVRASLRRKNAC